MAYKIQWRHDTAANWTSTNPTLSSGELAVETDTGKFKIGDGSTAWASLGYAGGTGAAQTNLSKSFGDGSDGDVSVTTSSQTEGTWLSSGVLQRDAYLNNLTISGSGQINTNGYKLFVKNVLNLASAGAGAINFDQPVGANASGATQGAGATAVVGITVGGGANGGAGGAGTTGAGASGTAGTAPAVGNGGGSNAPGAGGTGSPNAGGAAGAAAAAPTASLKFGDYSTNLIRGVALIAGGSSGRGGASGGGDATNSGGGGGGGGAGGGVVAIYAKTILRFPGASGVIRANGSAGGNGGNASAGVCGGGGGASGGGGGWVYIVCGYLAGVRALGFVHANGGNGGNGGNGFGSGAIGGGGGGGGFSGRITVLILNSSATNTGVGSSLAIFDQNTTGSAAVLTSGGNGGKGMVLDISL